MAEKKYYWLKLRKDFFKREDIRIIMALPNGVEHVLLYIELLLLGMESGGELRVNQYVTHTPKTLALVTDMAEESVTAALQIFESFGLLEYLDDGTVRMKELTDMVGCETKWAEKKRRYREKESEDNVLFLSTFGEDNVRQEKDIDKDKEIEKDIDKDIDKEIEIEKDIYKEREYTAGGGTLAGADEAKDFKKKYGSYGWVELTDNEHTQLMKELGEAELVRCIAYIDESAQSTGNRNRWRDWALILRRCSRGNWGRSRQTQAQQDYGYEDERNGEANLDRMKRYLEKLREGEAPA